MAITDTQEVETLIENLVDHFSNQMLGLFDEVPERFVGQTREDWQAQCNEAHHQLLTRVINQVDIVELMLINDHFFSKD